MADLRSDNDKTIEQVIEERDLPSGDRTDSLRNEEKLAEKLDQDYTFVWEKLKGTKIKEIIRYFQAYMTFKPGDEILDETKSNQVIPKPYEMVRATKAQLAAEVVGRQRPYGRAIGRRPMDEAADEVSWLNDWQLQENDWEYLIHQILSNTVCYGTQPLQITWGTKNIFSFKTEPIMFQPVPELPPIPMGERLVRRNGEPVYQSVPIYEGNIIRPVPFDDFGWDLEGTTVNSNGLGGHPCRWVYRKFWATKEDLKKETNPFGEPLYKNLDLLTDNPGENRLTENYAKEKRTAFQMPDEPLRKNQYLCVEFTFPTRIITKVTTEPFLIRNDFNPYGCINYIIPKVIDVDGELLGMSILRPVLKLCRALDAAVDDVLNEFELEDNKMWLANRDYVDIWANDFRTRSNSVMWYHGQNIKGSDVLTPVSSKGIAGEGMALMNILTRFIQNGGAYSDLLSGNPPQGLNLATETIALTRAIGLIYQGYLKVLEATLGKPLFEMMHKNNQRFMEAEQAIKIVGRDGGIIKELMVSPDSQEGEYSWYFDWAQKEMMRDVKIAQINQLIASVGSIQNWNPLVAELAKMVIEQLQEFTNQDDLQEKLDQTIQMAMMEKEAMLLMAQQKAIGSPKNPTNLPKASQVETARMVGQSPTAGSMHGG